MDKGQRFDGKLMPKEMHIGETQHVPSDAIQIAGEALEFDISDVHDEENISLAYENVNISDSVNTWKIQQQAASLMSHTMSSVTAAVGKQIENLSRQTTYDQPDITAPGQLICIANSSVPNATNVSSRAKSTSNSDTNHQTTEPVSNQRSSVQRYKSSLLHEKLFENNIALRKDLERLVVQNCGNLPSKVQHLLQSLSKTQVYFQECVISMQQAKHASNELMISMDEMRKTAESAQFPTT